MRPLPPDLLQLPEVTELILTDSAVSKYELRQLPGRAPSVTILNLSGTSVTDAEIQVLASMSSLQQIDLSRTAVTNSGIASLKAALPQCEIIH